MNHVWNFFRANQNEIWHFTWTTVWLAGGALIAGLVIALPLGWLAARFRWTYPPIVTLAGLIYTIPSLVLFVTLPGVLGTKVLSPVNVVVALTLYTVALLARVVADGLSSVDKDTLAAASAMGYTGRQRLFGVQFPIAVPVIGAGLRVAAVSNVSLISVASLVGVQQLGSLFTDGNQGNGNIAEIVLGLIMIVVLAFIFDGIILTIVKLLTPWRRAVRS